MANYRDLFEYPSSPECPALTTEGIAAAEDVLGVQLPFAYLEMLRTCNGGKLKCNTFYTEQPTCTADPYIQMQDIIGIGGEYGIDARYGSDYLIEEWNYPRPGVVLWSDGQKAIMLDYRECARDGEPPVIWVDMDAHESERIVVLAPSFERFVEKLVESPE
ncbi:MAG TPA: SMI1/KNR4 family protein [Chthonomonadaceae bacterium]|nr:SMI1/KNR4 family protein [Chthonomonadaceae bacterium]